MAADLGDVHDVQYGVDLPVSAAVQLVPVGSAVVLFRPGSATAPAGELDLGKESARISDLVQQLHGFDRVDVA